MLQGKHFLSDLRKLTAVSESLSSSLRKYSVLRENHYYIYVFGFPSTTLSNGNNIFQKAYHVPLQYNGITFAFDVVNLYHSIHKITGHTNTHTPSSAGKNIKINIFLTPEEAMFDNWQKLVS